MSDAVTPADPDEGDDGASDGTAPAPSEVEPAVEPAETEAEDDVVEITHGPTRLSRIMSIVAMAVGVALTTAFSLLALPFGLAGLLMVGGGLYLLESRGWVSIGFGVAVVGALVAGGFGTVPTELFLLGVSMTIFAWDAGQFAIDLGAQLGDSTNTRTLEATHAAFTLFALTLVNGFAYLVFSVGGTGRPAPGVALSLVGAIVVLWIYRR